MQQRNSSLKEKIAMNNTQPLDDYLSVFDDLPSMMWRAGLDGKCNYFNQSWLAFTGRTMDQEIGDGWLDGIHPDDAQRCIKTYLDAFERQEPFEMEYRLRHNSGVYRWILDIGRPIRDAHGNFVGYMGTCYDLTERKEMEKALLEANQALEAKNAALQESEVMFKGLFEQSPDAIVGVDEQGRMILVNQRTERLFGFSQPELIGQPVEMLMPDTFQEKHHRHVAGFIDQPRNRPMGLALPLFGRRKDGSLFPVDINLGPITVGGKAIVLATIRDTTDSKKAEEAINEREKLLTTAALSAPIVFFKVNRDGIVQFSLGRSLAWVIDGVDPEGKSIYDLYRDVPQVIESFQRALNGETFTTVIEAGGYVFEASYAPVQDSSGQVVSVVGVAADVTRHRMVEEALRESEAHFRTIFRDTVLGIHLIDREGRIVDSNPALQEMLGYQGSELHHRTLTEIIHPEDAPLAQGHLLEMMEGKADRFRMDLRYIDSGGSILMGRLVMSLFRDNEGKPLYAIGMVENITTQKQAEAELAELHRRLSDGAEIERLHLAQELHDGPLQELQAMSLQVSMLETMIEDEDARAETEALQEEIKKVVKSLRAMCGDLRPPALAPFGLEKAVRSHAESLQEKHPNIKLHLALAKDGKALSERVRLALFRIYQHSMANILRHANAENVWVSFQLNEDVIELRIQDDGQGFQVPSRWIDLVRQGHFGLVGSIERAESIGGVLDLSSSPGCGTEIWVRVPRREEEQVASRERFSAAFNRDR